MKRVLLVFAAAAAVMSAQQITSVGNLTHVVSNLDKSLELYRNVFGTLTLTPLSQFEANPAMQTLNDTPGAQTRPAELRVPGAKSGLELIEYRGIAQRLLNIRIQDPGAAILHLNVPNVDQAVLRAIRGGAKEITAPALGVLQGRALQDEDGFVVQVSQAQAQVTPVLVYPTEPPSRLNRFFPVSEGSFAFAVQNLDRTLEAYRMLGLKASTSGSAGSGLREGEVTIGHTAVTFIEFQTADRRPLRTRPQDPGTSILQLNVRGLDALLPKLNSAGFTIVTSGGRPVELNGTRAILVRDLNNLYLELIEPQQVL